MFILFLLQSSRSYVYVDLKFNASNVALTCQCDTNMTCALD
jgi:hypothetical protein